MSEIGYDLEDGVAVVTLQAPQRRNALTVAMAEELVATLDRADADESVGAVVIAGGASFCAGADLGVLGAAGADPAEDGNFRAIETIYRAFQRVGSLAVPAICAVRGAAVGAGMNLMLAADLRVVASDARLISGFQRIGAHPGGGHLHLLHRVAGRETAAAMGLFGQRLDGAEAVRTGMAWAAVDDAEVEPLARRLAAVPAADPALSRRTTASFRRETSGAGMPWDVAVEVERSAQMWSFRRRA